MDNIGIYYDNVTSYLGNKYRVVNNKFGGVAVFTMDMDDFNNDCCRGAYPLLNTLSKTLRKIGNRVQQNNCKKPAPVTTPKPAEITTGYDDGGRFPTT